MAEKKAAAAKKCGRKACAKKAEPAKQEVVKEEELAFEPAKEEAKAAAPAQEENKAALDINPWNVGFRAGDVYQALAASTTGMTVAEIAKAAGISTEETYLGIGWLMKEGKVKGENQTIALA